MVREDRKGHLRSIAMNYKNDIPMERALQPCSLSALMPWYLSHPGSLELPFPSSPVSLANFSCSKQCHSFVLITFFYQHSLF
jgi:hypothetical protein